MPAKNGRSGAEALGRFIKEQRKSLGLTQNDLALKLRPHVKITRSAFASFETGRILPSIPILEQIALVIGTDISVLIDVYRFPESDAARKSSWGNKGLPQAYVRVLSRLSRMSEAQIENTEQALDVLLSRDALGKTPTVPAGYRLKNKR